MPTSAFLPKPFKAPFPGAVFVPAASCSWGVGIPAACNGERVEVSAKLATQVPQRSKGRPAVLFLLSRSCHFLIPRKAQPLGPDAWIVEGADHILECVAIS